MPRWSHFDPAADRRLVKDLHDGADDSLTALCDIYVVRIYDYCLSLTGEVKGASDIVHDTFVDAAKRAPRLRDRSWLRPWLYAAARRRSLQRHRPTALHSVTELDGDTTPHSECAALQGLDLQHQEILFLADRHDLGIEELAAILGISARRANTRLTRARNHARTRTPDGTNETVHSGVSAEPPPPVPATLRHRILHTGSDPELAGYRAEIAARGGNLAPDGMPRQIDAPSPQARKWMLSGAGIAIALAIATVALVSIGPGVPGLNWRWPSVGQRPDPATAPSQPGTRGKMPRPGGPGAPPQAIPDMTPHTIPPEHGSSPHSTPSHWSPPPVQSGQLVVSPMTVHFDYSQTVTNLDLLAADGSLTWTATGVTTPISLSATTGSIPADGHATVQVKLDRSLLVQLAGKATVVFHDSEHHTCQIQISWDFSLL
jgi:DNA-directed RNA polymerase specialized sigma24 family protein